MKREENPCYGCVKPKRYLGCHDECPDRKEYIDKLEEEKAKIRKEKEVAQEFNTYREFAHHRLKHWDKKGK